MRQVTEELRADPEGEHSTLFQACIKETTRYYCGMKLLRLARQDICIPEANINVPKGAIVSISPLLTHMDPENYPNAEVWDPTRWMAESDDTLVSTEDMGDGSISKGNAGVKFLPFGGGSHRCPGEKMAMIMVTRAVATLLREYDFEWASPDTPSTTDFTNLNFDKVGTPWLRGGVRVRIRKA